MVLPRIFRLALMTAALALPSCNQGNGEEKSSTPENKRTVEITPDAVTKGKAAFATCAACHGENGEGRVGTAPALASESFLSAASDDMLLATIANGRPGTTMIAWKETLDEPTRKAIVAYLRSTVKTEPVKLNEAPLKGDATKGGALFLSICANCHGRTGAGYQESGSGTGIGRKGFLEHASDGYLRYIIKHGKSGTQMKSFAEKSRTAVANLSDEQIEDVIAFLRNQAW